MASRQHSIISTDKFLLKAGDKFSYLLGEFDDTWQKQAVSTLNAYINIYNYELNAALLYNHYSLKPFIGIGAGSENYRKRVDADKNLNYVIELAPFNEYSYFFTYCVGVTYQFINYMSVSAKYSWYKFNYVSPYSSEYCLWGIELSNKRENFSVGLTYNF